MSDAKDADEVVQDTAEDKDEETSEEEDGEDEYLKGFSSEGSDSSDEDDDEVDKTAIDVGRLPTIAKDDATVKMKLEKAKKQAASTKFVRIVVLRLTPSISFHGDLIDLCSPRIEECFTSVGYHTDSTKIR